ncbi:MAG: hypothetical protein OYH77_00045, partial [Pseudomonadota bacterium]|nr:hypothetical protein [Pseudomonadota bacterium]
MRTSILLFIALICATQATASSYLQRFKVSPQSERAQEIIRKAEYLVSMYPWLANLQQPTALQQISTIKHHLTMVHALIPNEFYSNERTIISYGDGVTVKHLKVSPPPHFYNDHEYREGDAVKIQDDFNYRQIKSLYWDKTQPAIVSIANPDGRVQGEFIYIERGLNHLHNIYSPTGFRFDYLLADVDSPILNLASGGYHFSWTLTKLNSELQRKKPRAERKHIHVFNIDLSGSHETFTTNPFYLFGDMYDTGLPDDTFGAVIALGGPL